MMIGQTQQEQKLFSLKLSSRTRLRVHSACRILKKSLTFVFPLKNYCYWKNYTTSTSYLKQSKNSFQRYDPGRTRKNQCGRLSCFAAKIRAAMRSSADQALTDKKLSVFSHLKRDQTEYSCILFLIDSWMCCVVTEFVYANTIILFNLGE